MIGYPCCCEPTVPPTPAPWDCINGFVDYNDGAFVGQPRYEVDLTFNDFFAVLPDPVLLYRIRTGDISEDPAPCNNTRGPLAVTVVADASLPACTDTSATVVITPTVGTPSILDVPRLAGGGPANDEDAVFFFLFANNSDCAAGSFVGGYSLAITGITGNPDCDLLNDTYQVVAGTTDYSLQANPGIGTWFHEFDLNCPQSFDCQGTGLDDWPATITMTIAGVAGAGANCDLWNRSYTMFRLTNPRKNQLFDFVPRYQGEVQLTADEYQCVTLSPRTPLASNDWEANASWIQKIGNAYGSVRNQIQNVASQLPAAPLDCSDISLFNLTVSGGDAHLGSNKESFGSGTDITDWICDWSNATITFT